MGRFVPIDVTVSQLDKRAPKVTGAKTYYNPRECWQYKVVYDRPGTYTFTVPSNAICARTVIVGGGGKPVYTSAGCCGWAGAGGGYSEKCHTITPGSTSFTIVVGRQSQDSTVSCNATSVHTASGAVAQTPGGASGGDWNSRGGCAGFVCNDCNGGAYSHLTGCININTATCCGYSLVMAYSSGDNSGNGCCNITVAGGGSAGSPLYCCGGSAWCVCSYGGNNTGSVASGGAGIFPNSSGCVWHYNCCDCVCVQQDGNAAGCQCLYHVCKPSSAGGGGGSHGPQPGTCRSWDGTCYCHLWVGGTGGVGGPRSNKNDTKPTLWVQTMRCKCNESYGGMCCTGNLWIKPIMKDPDNIAWWDICDISGAGSPGSVHQFTCISCCFGAKHPAVFGRPANSGEGAGTGGIAYHCCNPTTYGDIWSGTISYPSDLVNWNALCCLGALPDPFRCDAAYAMKDKLIGSFITCAGTLGGSGGVSVCSYNSKAGFGGGGGMAKCHIVCVCWGGAYNCCNANTSTLLAFPPCILDNLISNAGSGMAIVYYKEA